MNQLSWITLNIIQFLKYFSKNSLNVAKNQALPCSSLMVPVTSLGINWLLSITCKPFVICPNLLLLSIFVPQWKPESLCPHFPSWKLVILISFFSDTESFTDSRLRTIKYQISVASRLIVIPVLRAGDYFSCNLCNKEINHVYTYLICNRCNLNNFIYSLLNRLENPLNKRRSTVLATLNISVVESKFFLHPFICLAKNTYGTRTAYIQLIHPGK